MYAVTVTPSVANTRSDGLGHRNRTVHTARGPVLLTFSSQPLYLAWLPPEIAADPHLLVQQVTDPPRGPRLALPLEPGGVQLESGAALKPERVQLEANQAARGRRHGRRGCPQTDEPPEGTASPAAAAPSSAAGRLRDRLRGKK